jgi:hypothetical protein
MEIRLQDIPRQVEAALDQLLIALIDTVLVLDADHVIVAGSR